MSKRIILPIVAVSALLTAGVSMAADTPTPTYSIDIINAAGDAGTIAGQKDSPNPNQPMTVILYGTTTTGKPLPNPTGVSLPAAGKNGGVPCGFFNNVLGSSSNYQDGKNPLIAGTGAGICKTFTGIQIVPSMLPGTNKQMFTASEYASNGVYTISNGVFQALNPSSANAADLLVLGPNTLVPSSGTSNVNKITATLIPDAGLHRSANGITINGVHYLQQQGKANIGG